MVTEFNSILCVFHHIIALCSGLCVTPQVWIQSLFLEVGSIITIDGLYGNWQLWNLPFLSNLLLDA